MEVVMGIHDASVNSELLESAKKHLLLRNEVYRYMNDKKRHSSVTNYFNQTILKCNVRVTIQEATINQKFLSFSDIVRETKSNSRSIRRIINDSLDASWIYIIQKENRKYYRASDEMMKPLYDWTKFITYLHKKYNI
tara:strand:- start:791 stop:1201 length:411 start_codon:yes stop_codon:yes gene_type:complete